MLCLLEVVDSFICRAIALTMIDTSNVVFLHFKSKDLSFDLTNHD
jgi:hypothetical protein